MWNLQCLPITYRMGCKSLTLSQCSWESGPSPNFQAHEWALLCNISSMKNVTTYLLPSPRGVQKAFSNVEQNVPPPFSAISGNDNFILPVAEAKVLQSSLTPIFSHPHSQPISKSFKIYWEADHFATPHITFHLFPGLQDGLQTVALFPESSWNNTFKLKVILSHSSVQMVFQLTL